MDFDEAVRTGLSSATFNVSANIRRGDTRGLASSPAARIRELMDVHTVDFDTARFLLVQEQMREAGIDPETGLPLGADEAPHPESPAQPQQQPQQPQPQPVSPSRHRPGYVQIILLLDLGFPHESAAAAMEAANNNVAQALLSLLNDPSVDTDIINRASAFELLDMLEDAEMAKATALAHSVLPDPQPQPQSRPLIDLGSLASPPPSAPRPAPPPGSAVSAASSTANGQALTPVAPGDDILALLDPLFQTQQQRQQRQQRQQQQQQRLRQQRKQPKKSPPPDLLTGT